MRIGVDVGVLGAGVGVDKEMLSAVVLVTVLALVSVFRDTVTCESHTTGR